MPPKKTQRIERVYTIFLPLLFIVLNDTAINILWKKSVEKEIDSLAFNEIVIYFFYNPFVYLFLLLVFFNFIIWMKLLKNADLSFILPLTSIHYITVPLFSLLVFKESLNPIQIIGIILITLGSWVLSKSPPKSGDREEDNK